MGERNWVQEMDQIIERHTNVPTYQTRIVAQDIVTELLAEDPDLLNGWLQIRAADLIHETINHRDRSNRARGVIVRKQETFKDALDKFTSGDREPIHSFLATRWVVNANNDRKRLRDMNKEDLNFVAAGYEDRARQNISYAQFHWALARRVGDRTVGEVFTDEQLIHMKEQLLGTRESL